MKLTSIELLESLDCKQTGPAPNAGTLTLNGTTAVTVSTTLVTATSRIFLTRYGTGASTGQIRVDTQTAGSGFTVKSTDVGDVTGTVSWLLVN